MLIKKWYDIQLFYHYKTIYFPWINMNFKKSLKDRNQSDDSQCMFFLDSIKCETKAFLNKFFSYIVAIKISDTTKKKAYDSLTIMKLSVGIIH